MAQTDARAGFRLPWSSERSASESTDTDQVNAVADTTADAVTDWPAADQAADPTPAVADGSDAETPEAEPEPDAAPVATAEPAARTSARKPSKFLADLTKAMQAAAEESRALSLAQFESEAKAYIEQIHNRSGDEAAALRRAADDDVQSVREWSKAEIARIREETETRITARKGQLESEIEDHAARIEREVAQVQGRVTAFEEEMAAFFERLLQEDDPTRFATMAERLPEPPTFEEMSASTDYTAILATEPEVVAFETPAIVEDETGSEPEAVGDVEAVMPDDATMADTAESVEGSYGAFESSESHDGVEIDREAAMAAIQAAAEAAASAEVASDAAARAEAVADIAIEIVGSHDDEGHLEADPRATALGLTPDFDAAEAEAFASADADEAEEIPEIGDEALAARLAGLTPVATSETTASETTSTQVVVTGLVSVASIASFKRHLGRLQGVKSVGVSSGPDGEFLFAVHHTSDVVLRDVIPAMPSFQARVTGHGEGTLSVTAHDPESDN